MATSLAREYSVLKQQQLDFENLAQNIIIGQELLELALVEHNLEPVQECLAEGQDLQKKAEHLQTSILLSAPQDRLNCFLEVHAGAGGTEANDWAFMLLHMYQRWAKRRGLLCELIDSSAGESVGLKSATLKVSGDYAYGLLKNEQGVHRLVRISPFDASNRRHTTFAGVAVYSETSEQQINIMPADLKIDTYRASGAGGQHVNKTDSAVRITHIPTGIVVQSQADRSQLRNRAEAMKLLASKLAQKQKDTVAVAKQESYQEKEAMGWGSRVRSYVMHPYQMVKDARTGLEHPNPNAVLQGDLDDFIKALLLKSPCD